MGYRAVFDTPAFAVGLDQAPVGARAGVVPFHVQGATIPRSSPCRNGLQRRGVALQNQPTTVYRKR
jgi:hypothetical protein